MSNVFIPFEIIPCPEHDLECGGDPKPRHDLPVFREPAQAIHWMSQPANTHVHVRDGKRVLLQWLEHTPEEAKALGFTVPEGSIH